MSNPSPLRQRLRTFAEEIPELLRAIQSDTPLWRGLVHEARRKCGKPNCRCARGELHVSTVLADRSGEKQRNLTLAGRDQERFTAMTEEYRAVRRARARFVKITREMLELFDALEQIRREKAVRRYGGMLAPPKS